MGIDRGADIGEPLAPVSQDHFSESVLWGGVE